LAESFKWASTIRARGVKRSCHRTEKQKRGQC
jgi:hypothetical protein